MAEKNIEIIKSFAETINDHDIDGVISFFTDDAIVRLSESPREFKGKDGVREWMRMAMDQNVTVCDIRNLEIDGDQLTFNVFVHLDLLAKEGLDVMCPTVRVVFQDGLIKTFISYLDPIQKEIANQAFASVMSP